MQASSSASCVHLVQVDKHEEASDGQNEEPGVLSGKGSGVAESEYALEQKHKVFLSHSGAQKDFVEQLCIDMERLDRYPFFGKRPTSLPVGEKFPKLIFDAIKQCQVGVIVLSEEFFIRSKWPMLELNAMVKEFEKPNSRMKIIPLFYGISLNDFKETKNRNQWITQWEEWASNDKSKRIDVEEWKKAMRTLESINGLMMKEGMGDVKFRKRIVEEICRMVPRETRWDDSHVQGCHHICKVICDKMDASSSSSRICVVGMYGVGGIGKTTMCKALCNQLSSRFHENVCHVEFGQGSDMQLLQKALKKLTRISHEILNNLADVGEGYAYLIQTVHGEPIFLALDNVQGDYKTIQNARMYLNGCYGFGSVVLVTARSQDVLLKLNLKESQCLEMPELEEDEARSLFLNYTDLTFANEIDEKLMRKCMELCHLCKGDVRRRHYHPLALLGQQLVSNPKPWAEQLSKIVRVNQVEDAEAAIFSIFRNSFDSLKQEQQRVFMDLALIIYGFYFEVWSKLEWLCMVHGVSVDDMKDMLEVLKKKSLVEELSDGFTDIGMHDLLQEFAVLESKSQDSRDQRWVYQTDGKRAMGGTGQWRECVQRMCFWDEGWKGLQGLNLADFVNVEAFRLNAKMMMRDCWLGLDFSGLKHLKSLDVDTPGLTVTANGLSSLTNLGLLHVSARCLVSCLDKIGRLRSLQFLRVQNCSGVKVFDLTELKLLREVKIENIWGLMTLRGLSSRMASLRLFAVAECKSLRECLGLDELLALEALRLLDCGELKWLPWLGRLTNLRELDICFCTSIRAVPGLSDLVTLEVLDTRGCSQLASLPDLVKLTKLQKLRISECPVQEVPGLSDLVTLEVLDTQGCSQLASLPDLVKLTKLQKLHVSECPVQEVPGLSDLVTLEVLDTQGCSQLAPLPDLVKLTQLRELHIKWCHVQEVPGLDGLFALTSLSASFDNLSGELPDLSKLSALKVVEIHGWNGPIWTSIQNLLMLEELQLRGCKGEDVVPDLQNLKRLRSVEISGSICKDLSGLSNCTALENLRISLCDALERLPEFKRLTKLSALGIKGFMNLRQFSSASYLCSLKQLAVDELSLMQIVPHLEILSALRKLELWKGGCYDVLKRTSFSHIETLEIWFCETTEALDVSKIFPQLKELRLYGCSALERVTCNIPLTALTELEVEDCEDLVEFPDLSAFPQLETLRIKGCSAVMKLTCSSRLAALRVIKLVGCASQIELSDFSRFPRLEEFHVDDGVDHEDEDEVDHEDEDEVDHEDEDEVDHEDKDAADGSRWFCCFR